MKLIKTNPINPSTRHYKYVSKNILAKQNKLLKHLIFKINRSFGKSYSSGHTTVWGISSGRVIFKKLPGVYGWAYHDRACQMYRDGPRLERISQR